MCIRDRYQSFRQALYIVMAAMTKMLAADGEGATRLLECSCVGCPDRQTAVSIAKSVVQSSLVKCLLFGCDANWGRIMCAIGYTDVDFDIDKVDVDVASAAGTIAVSYTHLTKRPFSENMLLNKISNDKITLNMVLVV